MNKFLAGRRGEEEAARFLEGRGFRVIAKNFRSPRGEVDLIVFDAAEDLLVFVEVKTWTRYGADSLEYALNAGKRRRIIETAKFFLLDHREYNSAAIRFDVLFIGGDGVHHLASAFTERV